MLTFLKIIGTILLIILLVILVLLLLVLFVPFRYSLEFEYGKEKLCLKARVTWLLIFRFYLNFVEKKLFYKFKLLFLTILNSDKTDQVKTKAKIKKESVSIEKSASDEVNSKDEIMQENQPEIEEDLCEALNESITADAGDFSVKNSEPYEDAGKNKKRFSFKILHPAEIFYIISQKIADLYWKIRHKIVTAFRKFDKICAMIADSDNREAVVFMLSQVKALLKHVLPTKHGIYVKAGFADPATTGQALGAYSVVNNILNLNFIFEPDFDNEVLEAKVFVKGRIRVINLLIIAIKVITNKTIRKFIRRK